MFPHMTHNSLKLECKGLSHLLAFQNLFEMTNKVNPNLVFLMEIKSTIEKCRRL